MALAYCVSGEQKEEEAKHDLSCYLLYLAVGRLVPFILHYMSVVVVAEPLDDEDGEGYEQEDPYASTCCAPSFFDAPSNVCVESLRG